MRKVDGCAPGEGRCGGSGRVVKIVGMLKVGKVDCGVLVAFRLLVMRVSLYFSDLRLRRPDR